jgi:hypothetical protein
MRIALLASATSPTVPLFLQRNLGRLAEGGIAVAAVVLDENWTKATNPMEHAWRVARRQARVAGRSAFAQLLNIVAYKALLKLAPGERASEWPSVDTPVVRVGSLNSEEAIDAVKRANCELVCLMGARILTRKTLTALGIPIINSHASDPRKIRGGPPVVWEVLGGEREIVLTIHRVTEQLDAGTIHRQARQPIVFRNGIGSTTIATMQAALPTVCDLFEQVVVEYAAGTPTSIEFDPGPVFVTPSATAALRSELLCRLRS